MADDLVLVPGTLVPGIIQGMGCILPVEVAVVKFPSMISVEVLLHLGSFGLGV